MHRRHFLQTAFAAAASAPLSGARTLRANDVVQLGPDKIRLTRLAIGTGTKGGSIQRLLGVEGVADMLQAGYDQGVFFWETADAYRTHPHVAAGLKRVPREKVTLMTKTPARTADQMRTALDRYRQELGTDYIDIVLLHALRTPNWTEERAGAMEVLEEARQKKIIRSHGCSCHSLDALELSAKTPWVQVQLARINPATVMMDADPKTIIGVLRKMKAAGKGVIGMKILGEGSLVDRLDAMLAHALSLDCVDCFTIGPGNRTELADLIKRIPASSQSARWPQLRQVA